MAQDVSQVGEAPLVAPLRRADERRERARRGSYRYRFALLYVLLAAVAGAGIGTAVVLATSPAEPEAAAWSAWQPTGSAVASAKQIADRVSRGYKLPSGNQLAIALVGPPEVQDVKVRAIAVRPDTSRGLAEEDDVEVVQTESTVMYILCGLGDSCSIPEGEASVERHQLLRRQALELSLYSFKYLEGVDSAVVFLPPAPDSEVGTSVFLQRGDVAEELRQPLRATLAPRPPALGEIPTLELGAIDRLTRPRVYEYEFQQTQDGSAVIILSPVAPA